MAVYNLYGLTLLLIGVTIAYISYPLLSNVALLALGIGLMVLGLSILITPAEPMAKREIRELVEDSILNLERLLEYLHARHKAIYYPVNSDVLAIVPITTDRPPKEIRPERFAFREGKDLYIALKPCIDLL